MHSDNDMPEEIIETGSDELLSDDNLRLPAEANLLVRLHAIRAWLVRRHQESSIEIGEAALILQQVAQEEPQETRLRRSERAGLMERQHHAQQSFQAAQQRLDAYEEAQTMLEDCVTHTTTGERVLVEYYLMLDELVQRVQQEGAGEASPRLRAIADVQRRVEHVSAPGEEE